MKFAAILKTWLEEKHISQAELAQNMGVTKSFISQYVNGKRSRTRSETREKFAAGFGVDIETFLIGPIAYHMKISNEASQIKQRYAHDYDALYKKIYDIVTMYYDNGMILRGTLFDILSGLPKEMRNTIMDDIGEYECWKDFESDYLELYPNHYTSREEALEQFDYPHEPAEIPEVYLKKSNSRTEALASYLEDTYYSNHDKPIYMSDKQIQHAVEMVMDDPGYAASCYYFIPSKNGYTEGKTYEFYKLIYLSRGNLDINTRIESRDNKSIIVNISVYDKLSSITASRLSNCIITDRMNDIEVDGLVDNAYEQNIGRIIEQLIPSHDISKIYSMIKKIAVGDDLTLPERRTEVVQKFQKMGIGMESIARLFGKDTIENLNLKDLEILIGLNTAINNKIINSDQVVEN